MKLLEMHQNSLDYRFRFFFCCTAAPSTLKEIYVKRLQHNKPHASRLTYQQVFLSASINRNTFGFHIHLRLLQKSLIGSDYSVNVLCWMEVQHLTQFKRWWPSTDEQMEIINVGSFNYTRKTEPSVARLTVACAPMCFRKYSKYFNWELWNASLSM